MVLRFLSLKKLNHNLFIFFKIKYIIEEDKNYAQKFNKYLINNRTINKRNNYFLKNINNTSKNNKFYKENINNNEFNYMIDKKTIFHNYNNSNTILNKIEQNNFKNNIKTIKTLDRSSSVSDLLNNGRKKLIVYKSLNRNNSTSELNKSTLAILPLIKPRKIIINFCCGPYELSITNLNKKNINNKKYGHNSFFMGDKYNPDNYEIKKINRFLRNYHGKLFSK